MPYPNIKTIFVHYKTNNSIPGASVYPATRFKIKTNHSPDK